MEEGEIDGIRRVWEEGKEMEMKEIDMSVYWGKEKKRKDKMIEEKKGKGNEKDYRGKEYVVLERIKIEKLGKRMKKLKLEVMRKVGEVERKMREVEIIKGYKELGI